MNVILKIMILEKFGNQANFGQQVGLREPEISRIIHGRREPTPQEREAISRTLGVPCDELFGEEKCAAS